MVELPDGGCAVVVYGWALEELSVSALEALQAALKGVEGWSALAHGQAYGESLDHAVVGVAVAAAEPDLMAGEMLESGDWDWDDLEMMADTAVQAGAIAQAKAHFKGGRSAGQQALAAEGLEGSARPALWLVTHGYAKFSLLVDAGGKTHRGAAGDPPKRLRLPRGDHSLAAL
ncbi:MAG: hypothetical protein VX899_04600 [Myxococcota bacterium]|nr:hypothetical protein [Myxococcota bacterium]